MYPERQETEVAVRETLSRCMENLLHDEYCQMLEQRLWDPGGPQVFDMGPFATWPTFAASSAWSREIGQKIEITV